MRIAFVTGAFPKLSETFVIGQIVDLLELGHDVRIFAFEDPGESTQHPAVLTQRLLERTLYLGYEKGQIVSGIPAALRAPGVGLSALFHRDALARRLAHGAQGDFDVIYCHFGHVAERARQLRHAGFFRGPLVAVFHAADLILVPEAQKPNGYSLLFREAGKLLPISRRWRDRLVALGAEPDKIEVRHMGVACRNIAFRKRVKAGDGTLRVASVGRCVEKKGFEYGLRAVRKAEKLLGQSLRYDLVGDGPLYAELERLADELEFAGRVTFHGPRSSEQVGLLLDQTDILLAPSVTATNGDSEGIPVVLMEAMARGMPVISSHHSGIPELVEHGETGLLVAERDVDALAKALVRLAHDPDSWARLGEKARARIEAEFDAQRLVRELTALFSGLRSAPGTR
jgi:colanic acid/amylovoran biosynthesis glycosyltransferase